MIKQFVVESFTAAMENILSQLEQLMGHTSWKKATYLTDY